jgi:Domain of unknown function (DUF4838)
MAAEPQLLNCRTFFLLCTALIFLGLLSPCDAQPDIRVQVAPQAGEWERRAADDLVHYLSQMLGEEVLLSTARPSDFDLLFVVGEQALAARPELRQRLQAVLKKNPILHNDGIVSEHVNKVVYLAGSNDDSHYYAVARFLQLQGVRWYTPTSFGECVPKRPSLILDQVTTAYAPPFEVRNYWISWNGDRTDYEAFAHRNFFHTKRKLVGSHQLGNLLQKSKLDQNLVLNKPQTVDQVAGLLQEQHLKSEPISLGISDTVQQLKDPKDVLQSGGFQDKFFVHRAVADAYLPFYNALIQELKRRNPDSRSLFSFLAYTNLTLPPQRRFAADPSLVAFLAPIDIDPNHAFGDPRSPAKNDLLGALERWVVAMQGRVVMYDYDQGMLVWRDLPNPSHQVVAQDIKRYRELGILGFSTESRNALATTFTNIFFRGQLYWNPDFDVESELDLFYQNFYSQNADGMRNYWNALYQAWKETEVVDHEFFVANLIYTPELVRQLEQALEPLREAQPADKIGQLRRDFTLKSFALIKLYSEMTEASGGLADYALASKLGREALKTREELSDLHAGFTTHRQFKERGPAFWPGEVAYFEELAKRERQQTTPLVWQFKEDREDHGLWRNWASDAQFNEWQEVKVDRLFRHQGLTKGEMPDDGYVWYACQMELTKEDTKEIETLVFPGIFNNSWLYLNGNLVDWRPQKELWWSNDYRFLWEANLGGSLKIGRNTLVVRTEMKKHPSGIFRRPFFSKFAENEAKP